jgi:SAM-dependent methyltransferase
VTAKSRDLPLDRARDGHDLLLSAGDRGGIIRAVTDPYLDGVYRWWHLSAPSPELVAAEADGWLGQPGTAVDIGCGLGTEIAYLAAQGWNAVGVDLSRAALVRAKREHPDVSFAQADVLSLPLPSRAFHLALDRGCFHYLSPARWADYAAEVRRVLRPGGRLLLRACLTSRGVRNDVTEAGIAEAFTDWVIDRLGRADLPSDTRTMQALIIRLTLPHVA